MDRNVGSRQRATDDSNSRLNAIIERVQNARDRVSGEDGPDGVDARTRGDNRGAVDATSVEIDEDAVESASDGSFEGVPTTKKQRSRLERARSAAKKKLSDLSESQKQQLQEQIEDVDLKDLTKEGVKALASRTGSSRRAGTTGTENTEIAKRATDAATVRAPMGGSLRTVGDERIVEDMARAGAAGGSIMGSSSLLFGDPVEGSDSPDDGISGFSFGMNTEDTGFQDETQGFGISIMGSADSKDQSEDQMAEELLDFHFDEQDGGLL